jgi:hypothetical protein
MTRFTSALALALVALGCGGAEPVAAPPLASAGSGTAATPRPDERPRTGPSARPGAASACADFAAIAGQPLDQAERLDLDDDGLGDAAVREPGCGLRCTFRLYRLAADGCWVPVGELRDLMSEPYCLDRPARHTWCRLSGMRLMIHGDAQEYTFSFDGTRYDRDGLPGTHYVPPRPKR